MIQKVGDYYTIEQSTKIQNDQQQALQANQNKQVNFQVTGNIKQRIQMIKQRFQNIKKIKLQQQRKSQITNISIFDKVQTKQIIEQNKINVDFYIPQQVLKIDQKISQIEQKLNPNQIFKLKMDKKGPLVARINILHDKLKKILQKSSQVIIQNIQNYCASLDDKEQHLKIVFLKQALLKAQGLKQQINVLQIYLTNLNRVQTKIKSIQPINKTVENHNEILQLNNKLSTRIKNLFNNMKTQYQTLAKEIQTINV